MILLIFTSPSPFGLSLIVLQAPGLLLDQLPLALGRVFVRCGKHRDELFEVLAKAMAFRTCRFFRDRRKNQVFKRIPAFSAFVFEDGHGAYLSLLVPQTRPSHSTSFSRSSNSFAPRSRISTAITHHLSSGNLA